MVFPLNSTNWWLVFVVVMQFFLAGCESAERGIVEITGPTMGTSYSVKVVATDVDPTLLQAEIEARLIELNQVFSTYIPDSEISLLNGLKKSGSIDISNDMMRVLAVSFDVHEMSKGSFDVTVGPVVNLWGFGPDGPRDGIPEPHKIASALERTGMGKLTLSSNSLQKPGNMYIDLSAVAKGFAVDEIAELLERKGAENYMVEIGGEVRARGRNVHGDYWRIGLEAPDRTERRLHKVLPVVDMALATSGDYRNFFVHEGVNYSHSIDPRTGWPVTHNLASVSVLHSSAAMADALATALTVHGPDEILSLSNALQLRILAIIRTESGYKEVVSEEMANYLESQ